MPHFFLRLAKKGKKALFKDNTLAHTATHGIYRQCVVPAPVTVCQLLALDSRVY
jgi:hypothetical protein